MTDLLTDTILPTYARAPVTFVEGDGLWLVDDQGERYLDFSAGIAVLNLGHRRPEVVAAAHAQLDRLWHTSNLYWTLPMVELARKLSDRFGGPGTQAFFCNSGAEAIEAAHQVRAQGDRQARDRRARGLLPRPDDGRGGDHRPAGQAGAVRAAPPGGHASRS